ncbi:hypothetical protein C8R45DRAFT_1220407 [Mycena sanguinolenta]|nr:hypothetical protein C8R45DRAFT_1220407 [Mycena sanguinolenta]
MRLSRSPRSTPFAPPSTPALATTHRQRETSQPSLLRRLRSAFASGRNSSPLLALTSLHWRTPRQRLPLNNDLILHPTQATLIRVAGTKFDERVSSPLSKIGAGLYVALRMEQCEKWLRCLRRRMAGECGASYILPGRIGTCVNRWELPSFAEMTAACDGTRAALVSPTI